MKEEIKPDFEQTVKSRIRKKWEIGINGYKPYFDDIDKVPSGVNVALERYGKIIDQCDFSKCKVKKSKKEILKMYDHFAETLTEQKLKQMYEEIDFTEEEKLYMQYHYLKGTLQGERLATIDVLVRRIITDYLGADIFPEMPDKESVNKKVESMLNAKINTDFNLKINCGGYALKIDKWIDSYDSGNFNKDVYYILKKFPFVRLLGNTKLKNDEYLVFYRSSEKGKGHHFIRVEDDGRVVEKNGVLPIQIFKGWNIALSDCKETAFAVKKEHGIDEFKENINIGNEEKIPNCIEYIKPLIIDGKLINMSEFLLEKKENKEQNEDKGER